MLTSMIIPVKNEEFYLPKLLQSVKEQTFKDLEVIVADAGSIDRTREIAKDYGCLVVEGGMPAEGRNNGAKYAKGKILLFKDGDSPLPHSNFLSSALEEFNKRNLDVAGTLQSAFSSKNGFAKLRYKTYLEFFTNRSLRLAEDTPSPLMMNCIFAKKEIHDKIGGFDKTIEFGEENEYAGRAKNAGANFGILKTCGKIGFNTRRFEKNEVETLAKNLYFLAGQKLGHEFRRGKSIIGYW